MKADITLKNVSITIGIIITVSGVLLGLLDLYISHKISNIKTLQTANGAKLDMLLEERMVKMKQGELYDRFNRVLNRTNESSYSIDRYIEPKEEPKPSEKK